MNDVVPTALAPSLPSAFAITSSKSIISSSSNTIWSTGRPLNCDPSLFPASKLIDRRAPLKYNIEPFMFFKFAVSTPFILTPLTNCPILDLLDPMSVANLALENSLTSLAVGNKYITPRGYHPCIIPCRTMSTMLSVHPSCVAFIAQTRLGALPSLCSLGICIGSTRNGWSLNDHTPPCSWILRTSAQVAASSLHISVGVKFIILPLGSRSCRTRTRRT